jgi:hypothetical protein
LSLTTLSSKKYGVGIRDPKKKPILYPGSGPGVKKASDPGSGSATLILLIVTGSGYGSRNPIEFGSNPDTSLDPHTLIVTDIQTAKTFKDLDYFIV